MREKKNDIFKWIAVILTLLFIPYGSVFLVVFFSFLFFRKKVFNIELLILYFLIFFVQNVAGGDATSGINNIRFLLIPISLLRSFGVMSISYRRLFKKASYFSLLIIFILLHSLLFSYNPANSLFELVVFTALMLFAFQNTYFENIQQRTRLINSIEAMYLAIIILSAISFLEPSISYLRNGVGFQGISVHPNAFGVVLAPYCGWKLLQLLKKHSFKTIMLFLISFVFVYLSLSRTSLLSVILGLLSIMIINKDLRVLISKKVLAIMFIGGVFIIFNFNTINTTIFNFLDKSKTGSIQESVMSSRGAIIESQMHNIEENPFFGIGFKIPSNLNVGEDLFEGGKAYEKGNMLIAAIEELGVVGLIILLITLLSLLKLKNNKESLFLIVPLVALFSTMGEATLFSIGGIGVLIWAFVFFSFHNGILEAKIKKHTPKIKLIT